MLFSYVITKRSLFSIRDFLFFNQLSTSLACSDYDYRLSSYKTDAGAEVDLILEVGNRIMTIDGHEKKIDEVQTMPWQNFLKI